MVYVQDINGKPMMPTTRNGKVRRLLKDKKAVVVNLCPFTIKLMYVTSDYKQEIVLGVDAGTFEVFGFRLFDRVMFENSYYFIFGRRKTGSFNIRDIDGKNQKNVTYKKFKLSRCKRFMIQKEMN